MDSEVLNIISKMGEISRLSSFKTVGVRLLYVVSDSREVCRCQGPMYVYLAWMGVDWALYQVKGQGFHV